MKCSFCTYDYKPENVSILKEHAEKDIIEGITRGVVPVVVWRDNMFILVEKAEDGEQTYEIGIVDHRPINDSNLVVETLPYEEEEEPTPL